MTGILEQLELDAMKMRRKDSRLIMFYKDLKVAASIPTNDHVPPQTGVPGIILGISTPTLTGIVIYNFIFLPQTIRGWIPWRILLSLLTSLQKTQLLSYVFL